MMISMADEEETTACPPLPDSWRGRRRCFPNSDDDELQEEENDVSSSEERYCSANSALGTASFCSFSSPPAAIFASSSSLDAAAPLSPLSLDTPSAAPGTHLPPWRRRRRRQSPRADASEHYDGESPSSPSEDSIGDYGSDCSGGNITAFRGNGSNRDDGGRSFNNTLVMNSSVAFGSTDWEEFMHESAGNDFLSLFEQQVTAHTQLEHLSDVEEEKPSLDDSNQEPESCPNFTHHSDTDESPYIEANHLGDDNENNDDQEPRPLDHRIEPVSLLNDGLESNKHTLPVEPVCDHLAILQLQAATPSTSTFEEDGRGFPELFESTSNSEESKKELALKENTDRRVFHGNGFVQEEVKKPVASDFYDEMVLDMEEILLDSESSLKHKPTLVKHASSTLQSCHRRTGSSTASTSGTDDAYRVVRDPPKIDWIEIVGAKQKKGDVSFGERLVGVREYTVYKIKVWSGNQQWEVERRYRDFFALHRQLRTLFSQHNVSLPPPWSAVEQESRKIFGNISANVVSHRSALIQDCLHSILDINMPSGTSSCLASFLSPGEAVLKPNFFNSLLPKTVSEFDDGIPKKLVPEMYSPEDVLKLGKTISLVLELKPHKSMRQMLEAQHYTCAGCHRKLDAGTSFLQELVQTFGGNKPRFCEYTGQLFCSSCHTNDSAVLPAKVLHQWDFSLYPVSQFAKAYLDSIYDQPMLCVSAVNPFLFSKVPALRHVMGVRRKIGAMFPYLRCPFRVSVQRGLGIRRYLLEDNDFFALRDLVDLSKGAFAALPTMVESLSSKILEHITQQCLFCYDSGVPCAARQSCHDPLSLIFPFQESEATRCSSCGSIFHKSCFLKLIGCPCGKESIASKTTSQAEHVVSKVGEELNSSNGLSVSVRPSATVSSSGFFTHLLAKAMPVSDKLWKPKNSSPVILMGSLPATTSL